jgi:hypothetical protein
MRLGSNVSVPNEGPCGGIDKQPVHYLTKSLSRNYVQWRVYHPSSNGMCLFKLGTNDDKLITLIPKDGSSGNDGVFACGR